MTLDLAAIEERAKGVLEMLATCTPVADWPPDMDHESDSDSYLWGCCREALEDASNHVLALAEEVRRLREALEQVADAATRQYLDWVHFHEFAMADPFEAEAIAQGYAEAVAGQAHQALAREPGRRAE